MKTKVKTVLVLLLTTALVLQVFTSVPSFAAETDTDYKAAYYKLIKELHNSDEFEGGTDRYKLIYLDNDSIPELLVVDVPSDTYHNNGTYRYDLYTFYDGKAILLGCYASGVASAGGYRGDTSYIKKSGKLLETYVAAASGDGENIVYSLQNGEMVEIARGAFNIASETTKWNGKEMSSEKYTKKLNKVFKTKKAISFEGIKTISYRSMRKKLK
ncbi:MAG: hypothetical protein IKP88_12840 [Lachnospiraceae bacterium]|nr:hypothetical protein [Lachnospiraceae bacterium]